MKLLRSLATSLFGEVGYGGGWASASLRISVRDVALSTGAALQLMVGSVAVFTLGVTPRGVIFAAGTLCLLLYAVLALRRPLPVVPLFLGMYLLGFAGYVASGDLGSALTFASCWQINAASCLTALMIGGRRAFALVLVPIVLISAGMVALLPNWGADLPLTIIVTQTSIIVVGRLGFPALQRFARQADDKTASAERAVRDAGIVRSASRKIAEDARVLHDTAINTLGAIANGGVAVADPVQVREQCVRDVAQLDALRSSGALAPDERASLRELFDLPGLPIHRSGLGDAELARADERLPQEAVRAVVRCAREAVTNAAKHSGADHVEIRLDLQGPALTVSVRDGGRGFDGTFDAGRGVANSIFARARTSGIGAELRTAPGDGTEVRLTARLDDAGAPSAPHRSDDAPIDVDVADTVVRLRRRAGSLWGAGVTAVSVVLTAAGGTNHHLALYPMIAVMALCWAATTTIQRAERRSTLATALLPALLIIGAPAVFVLSAAAVGFGSDGPEHWQALAATGPFVLFLSLRPPRSFFRAAAGIWIGAILLLSAVTWPHDHNAAVIIISAGFVGLGFSLVWQRFQTAISRIGEHTSRARFQEFEANLQAEMQTAAQATFRRWMDAGLESSIILLRRMAAGDLSPASAEARQACGREETYLRQLTLVSPELVHLGRAVMPVLAAARERDLDFTVRLGGRDAPDEATAEEIALLMLDAVAVTPHHGSLTATVFPVHDGIRATLIGPHTTFEPLYRAAGTMSPAALHYEQLGGSDLLEMSFAVPA